MLLTEWDAEKDRELMIRDATEQGIEQGRELGIELGRELGIELGRELGIELGIEQVVAAARAAGIDEGTIAGILAAREQLQSQPELA